MIVITWPFPAWLYRIAPMGLFVSGLLIGLNVEEPEKWTQGPMVLWSAIFATGVFMAFCNGAVKDKEPSE